METSVPAENPHMWIPNHGPEPFDEVLINHYLFESRQRRWYSARRIQQIVKYYAENAGIAEAVHPHLFRHQMLTWLTARGLPDAAIQLISGHSSKKSLEVYQHLSLAEIAKWISASCKALGH
jgi:site-specific recombinase XerD